MAKRVEGVTERLLEAAREEFLERGFEGASLRTIAERAGSSKGAIYTRYPDKESLFKAIVNPIIDELCAILTRSFSGFETIDPQLQTEIMNSYADKGIDDMVDYIYDHFTEFKILVCAGESAIYTDFMHRVVDLDVQATYRYVESTGNDAVSSGRLTPELMHMITSSCFSGMFEVVAHDMSREEAKDYIARLCAFYRAGWQTIFDPTYSMVVLNDSLPTPPECPGVPETVEALGGAP